MNNFIKFPSRHYSPLRYPGGKAILSGFLGDLIKTNNIDHCIYVEPFAGGAGAALNLLFLEKVDKIIINDIDKSIYSFWVSILKNTDDFIEKIKDTKVTIDEWYKQKNIIKDGSSSEFNRGFATFFLNRTNRSGIIEGGPIGGVDQSGKWKIDARFNKAELINRIMNIATYKSRINVKNEDGINLLKNLNKQENYFIYLDPPYYIKGECLYLNHYVQKNHERLARYLNKHNNIYWVLTYDNVKEIKALYRDRYLQDFKLNYHIDAPKLGKEIIVFSDKIDIQKLREYDKASLATVN